MSQLSTECSYFSLSLCAQAYTQTLTCGLLKVGLVLLFDGLRVVVRCALVHSQGGDLFVSLPTVVAVVGLAGRVDHMVLVQAGVLRESLITPWHGAHVRFLSWTHGQVQHIVIIGQKKTTQSRYIEIA